MQRVCLLFLFLSFLSCSHGAKTSPASKPDWVDGVSQKYSKDAYVIGVGMGDTRGNAENQARVALAQTLEVRVQTELKEETFLKSRETERDSAFSFTRDLTHDTRLTTEQVLEGVEIADIWMDQTGRYHALAILGKLNAILRLRERIGLVENELAALLDQAQDNPRDRREQLRLYLRMQPLVERRRLYRQQLMVLSTAPAMDLPKDDVRYGEIEPKLNALMGEYKVNVEVIGEQAALLRDALVEGLNQARFKVATQPLENPDLLLRARVHSEQIRNEEKQWQWAQSEVVIDMIDSKTTAVFGTIRKNRREGAKDLNRAKRLSVETMADELSREVALSVLEYLQKG